MADIYPWLVPTWKKWQELAQAERSPSAMLCASPEGMGVSELVHLYTRTLVCTESATEPCGFCHSCDLSKSENHPDIHWISPEAKGKSITVEQIRRCNRWAMETSQLGGVRVIVIQPAEAMNESASNALLKTLEAPPENCVFLLLSHNRVKLLPTITSRCQVWDIVEPDVETTYQWLKQNADAPVNHNGIRLSKGAPLRALAFFQEGENDKFIELEKTILHEIAQPFPNTGTLYKCIKDEPVKCLLWLSVLMSDIQKLHFGVVETGMCPGATDLAERIDYQTAYKATQTLNQLREQLINYTGLNTELLFTNWILELHGEVCL